MADKPKPTPAGSGKQPARKPAAPKAAPGSSVAPRRASGEVAKPEGYQSMIEPRNAVSDFFAPVGGFGVTLSNMFRPTVTEQYPSEKVPAKPRYHGRHQLNRYADGLEKCIGCELCAWACPADAIYVEGGDNTPEDQHSPGERYGSVYQINYLRCIFCGLCIEACPTRALTMTNEYELAGPTREGLIFEKQDLLAPMGKNMLSAPHPMVPGTTDGDYYRGDVTEVVDAQVKWVRENRPEDETLPENVAKAAGVARG